MQRLILWVGLCFILTAASTHSVAAAAEKKMLVEIEIKTPADILKLKDIGVDIVTERTCSPIHAIVTDKQREEIKGSGWAFHVVIEDLNRYFKEKIDVDGNLGSYHTYTEMVDELQRVATAYPNITRLVDIGDSWEKTQGIADHDIWALKISDNPEMEERREPDVLIVGCHHARELITVEIPLAIIRTLTENYAVDSRTKFLVNHREIWIVPMLNPDGHVYVEETDSWWRKNRNTNGYGNASHQGVDLNRNYSFQWGYDNIGSSPHPQSETYRGTTPFSEPESQALKNLVEKHHFIISLSYHSYGNLFLFPWGYITADTEDHATFKKLGKMYTRQNAYTYGNSKDGIIYKTNGEMNDWMYGEQKSKDKAFGVTIEVGNTFQPPESEVPELIQENVTPALRMILAAGRLKP
ncbi:MAG TPA: M14 family metallopeptidase [Candidatus Brocadiaceae bacterium]|nr:M14 family metallopeptidase [Candidatus Brocadiaceae bacterium]